MKSIIVWFVSFFGLSALAQEDIKVTSLPKFSIRANVGIPKVASSKALRSSFSGVSSLDINLNYKLFGGFFAGIGFNHVYYKSQKHFREQFINTSMQMQNGYLKIGYDHFFSDRGFATMSLNTGFGSTQFSAIKYKNDSLIGKYPTHFTSSFMEPSVALNFLVEPNFAFGAYMSYHYNFSQFNPAYAGFDKWLDYTRISNKWNTSLITIGFGFYYAIGKVN
jgi:hypothetical protein